MKNYTTQNQEVSILDVNISRKSGYGQYKLIVDIECNGTHKKLIIHTTDSVMFDESQDADDVFEFLMSEAKNTIERAIDEYIIETYN